MQDQLKETRPRAEDHLGLVHHCASRFRGRGIEYEELYSTGCIGLLKAVQGFDPGRGLQFSTYAVPVILGEIKRLFRDSGSIRVSRRFRESALRLRRLQEEYEKEKGCAPTLSELSQIAGISESDAAQALCMTQAPVSLTDAGENRIAEDGSMDGEIGDRVALGEVMKQLEETDRKILELRYYREYTQSKTAAALGMTQVQVSRRERKILSWMRSALLQ